MGGPTASTGYWSASTFAEAPNWVWGAGFAGGTVGVNPKTVGNYVRAVRVGSCN